VDRRGRRRRRQRRHRAGGDEYAEDGPQALHDRVVECRTRLLPDEVLGPVLALLTRLAVRRHGQSAVVAALSRAERAPGAINAF
jgi:hypothetical protein